MGIGPPPGKKFGIYKCLSKIELVTHVLVAFEAHAGTAFIAMSEEDAKYFVVGQSYELQATTP